jgi:hypothetical protein
MIQVQALLSGESKKADGTLRKWNCVECHNLSQIKGGALLQVVEKGSIRQVNMSTFIGTILCNNEELHFFLGECLSKNNYGIQVNLPF